jgi:preprotein translocase subunit SecF
MKIKLIPATPSIPFMAMRHAAFALSIVLIVASFGLLFTKGLALGIDFTGGLVMEFRTEQPVELGALRTAMQDVTAGDVSLQHFGSKHDVMLRVQVAEGTNQPELVKAIKTQLESTLQTSITYRKTDYVGPQVGDELIRGGAMALGFAFLAILVYIWFRFEWNFGIGALVALAHDVILALGFYAFMGLEFNLSSIAAILTIIGYSINDSVVIYDRVRENLRRFKKMPLNELLSQSLNETLSRTILTAGTTIVALLALVMFGGEVIRGFSLIILFGVVVGTYSSIFIAAPVLLFSNLRREDDDAHEGQRATA